MDNALTAEGLARVDQSELLKSAGSPRIEGSLTIRNVRTDLWAAQQVVLARFLAHDDPTKTDNVRAAATLSKHVFTAITAFVAGSGSASDHEMLDKLAKIGEQAVKKPGDKSIDELANAVANVLALRSSLIDTHRGELDG